MDLEVGAETIYATFAFTHAPLDAPWIAIPGNTYVPNEGECPWKDLADLILDFGSTIPRYLEEDFKKQIATFAATVKIRTSFPHIYMATEQVADLQCFYMYLAVDDATGEARVCCPYGVPFYARGNCFATFFRYGDGETYGTIEQLHPDADTPITLNTKTAASRVFVKNPRLTYHAKGGVIHRAELTLTPDCHVSFMYEDNKVSTTWRRDGYMPDAENKSVPYTAEAKAAIIEQLGLVPVVDGYSSQTDFLDPLRAERFMRWQEERIMRTLIELGVCIPGAATLRRFGYVF